jgi:hypothetical protein
MITVAIYSGSLVFPKFSDSFIFKNSVRSLGRTFRNILVVPLAVVVVLFSYIYGESIKVGLPVNAVTEYVFTNEYAEEFLPYLAERFSPSLVSLFITFDNYGRDIDLKKNLKNSREIFSNFAFRVSKIFGNIFSVEKPEAGSVMRINYLQITNGPPREREGTSPGIIPGFFMVLPIPLALLVIAIYITGLIWLINVLTRHMKKPISILGALLLIRFLNNFFASPVDLLLIFEPITISFCLFIFFALKLIRYERSLLRWNKSLS